jgi:hypothetical protein
MLGGTEVAPSNPRCGDAMTASYGTFARNRLKTIRFGTDCIE